MRVSPEPIHICMLPMKPLSVGQEEYNLMERIRQLKISKKSLISG